MTNSCPKYYACVFSIKLMCVKLWHQTVSTLVHLCNHMLTHLFVNTNVNHKAKDINNLAAKAHTTQKYFSKQIPLSEY